MPSGAAGEAGVVHGQMLRGGGWVAHGQTPSGGAVSAGLNMDQRGGAGT